METLELKDLAVGLKVLYVEDIDVIRSSIKSTLSLYFSEVYDAEDGEKGLELFYKYMPDLVITDIEMPILNGLDMIKEIKKISPQTPIIITTAYDDVDFLLRAIEIGVDRFLVKPIQNDKLIEALIFVTNNLKNMRLAEVVKKEIEEKKSETIYNFVIEHFISKMALPAALFNKDKQLVILNYHFRELFSDNELHELFEGKRELLDFIIDGSKGQNTDGSYVLKGFLNSSKIAQKKVIAYISTSEDKLLEYILVLICLSGE